VKISNLTMLMMKYRNISGCGSSREESSCRLDKVEAAKGCEVVCVSVVQQTDEAKRSIYCVKGVHLDAMLRGTKDGLTLGQDVVSPFGGPHIRFQLTACFTTEENHGTRIGLEAEERVGERDDKRMNVERRRRTEVEVSEGHRILGDNKVSPTFARG
jgi:hypothetical protein